MAHSVPSGPYRQSYRLMAHATPQSEFAFSLATAIPIFVIGALSGIPVRGIGKMFVGELLLVGLAPLATPLLFGLRGTYGRTARILFLAMFVSLLGIVGSDFFRNTDSHDYLRGWSRWIFTAASFSSLAYLGSRSIRAFMLFVLGWSVGMCLAPFFVGIHGAGFKYMWKFYAAMPCCISMLYLLRNCSPKLVLGSTIAFAGFSSLLDYRTPAFTCATIFGVCAFALVNRKRFAAGKRLQLSTLLTAVLVGAFCITMSLAAVQFLGEKYGYAERFERSNHKRLANIEIALQAISRSPWIGYGSWPRDPEFARMRDKLVKKKINIAVQRAEMQKDLIVTHSQILQGWVEGGLLGLTFFLVSGVLMVRAIVWQAGEGPYLPLTPVMTAAILFNGWHFLFSPFSAEMRIFVPIACVIVCYMLQTKSDLQSQARGGVA